MNDHEDRLYRQEGEKLVGVHSDAIEKLDDAIKEMQHRRDQRQALLDKAELQAKGIRPCVVCQRHVASPCNSRGGMAENGPWDSFCRDFMDNRHE